MAYKFNILTGNLDYYEPADSSANLDYVPLSTSANYTIPTDTAFVGVDEFTVNGDSTLTIEGNGRMMLIG